MRFPLPFATLLLLTLLAPFPEIVAQEPIDIGSRRELLVDHHLIAETKGEVALKLHPPERREVAITFDEPWEGNSCGYPTVFQDGDIYRLYYRGHAYLLEDPPLRMAQSEVACYAESKDGIHWEKPVLNLHSWPGVGTENNIIWPGGAESHNFAPFKDTNPDCPPEARYKAVAGTVTTKGLLIFQSADGIHWSKIKEEPVVTEGAFDSHNTVFWDDARKQYVMYLRTVEDNLRHIARSTSEDFINWSAPESIAFPHSPPQQMYTNQILPYYRAPHVLVGLPARYVTRPMNPHIKTLEPIGVRNKIFEISDERIGTDLTDSVFISSRDGLAFERWNEAFLRPGPEEAGRWIYGDNYIAYGFYETPTDCEPCPNELSILAHEGYWRESHRLRRYSMRIDGFVSMNASYEGGEFTTKPLLFTGDTLTVNYATSAAGSLRVELQNAGGEPIPGFALEDSVELYGDSIRQTVSWTGSPDLGALAGNPIRIRFALRDGDLFSYQFE